MKTRTGSGNSRREKPTRQVWPPEPLTVRHDCSGFQNGQHASLDQWLRERALSSDGLSARTYVICDANAPARVVGYYAISTAMEQRIALPKAKLRRGMPEQVPLLLIGRLAIDHDFQGMGLGTDLLADALRRCMAASEVVGVRGIIAHAIDEEAVRYYERHGFLRSPLGERVMFMPIETARAIVE